MSVQQKSRKLRPTPKTDDSEEVINNSARQSTTPPGRRQENVETPSIRTINTSPASLDIDQWLRASRALAEKYDDLIVKLDALLFQIDCCLGAISADEALRKLGSNLRELTGQAKGVKRSLVAIDSTIKGANTIASKLPDSPDKQKLLGCIAQVAAGLAGMTMSSSAPALVRHNPSPGVGRSSDKTDRTDKFVKDSLPVIPSDKLSSSTSSSSIVSGSDISSSEDSADSKSSKSSKWQDGFRHRSAQEVSTSVIISSPSDSSRGDSSSGV